MQTVVYVFRATLSYPGLCGFVNCCCSEDADLRYLESTLLRYIISPCHCDCSCLSIVLVGCASVACGMQEGMDCTAPSHGHGTMLGFFLTQLDCSPLCWQEWRSDPFPCTSPRSPGQRRASGGYSRRQEDGRQKGDVLRSVYRDVGSQRRVRRNNGHDSRNGQIEHTRMIFTTQHALTRAPQLSSVFTSSTRLFLMIRVRSFAFYRSLSLNGALPPSHPSREERVTFSPKSTFETQQKRQGRSAVRSSPAFFSSRFAPLVSPLRVVASKATACVHTRRQ